jgi:hypothetical protein
MHSRDKLLEKFDCNPGASDEGIRDAEAALGHTLPEDYVAFLRHTNGGCGWIGLRYTALFAADELAEMNRIARVDEFQPGLLIFGGNGGLENYGFDKRKSRPWPVVMIPGISLGFEDAIVQGASFSEFLQYIYDHNEWDKS